MNPEMRRAGRLRWQHQRMKEPRAQQTPWKAILEVCIPISACRNLLSITPFCRLFLGSIERTGDRQGTSDDGREASGSQRFNTTTGTRSVLANLSKAPWSSELLKDE